MPDDDGCTERIWGDVVATRVCRVGRSRVIAVKTNSQTILLRITRTGRIRVIEGPRKRKPHER